MVNYHDVFITLAPGPNVIKLFTVVINYIWHTAGKGFN
jgi:hypothetical protein